jgi:hypothetical protein
MEKSTAVKGFIVQAIAETSELHSGNNGTKIYSCKLQL